jgi:DoxX-like family
VMAHLGYLLYFLTIMGVAKVLAVAALLVPRFPRLKEWAYAGLLFVYVGAACSHFAVGDAAAAIVTPLIFAVITLASWALRPPARRDPAPHPGAWMRARLFGGARGHDQRRVDRTDMRDAPAPAPR